MTQAYTKRGCFALGTSRLGLLQVETYAITQLPHRLTLLVCTVARPRALWRSSAEEQRAGRGADIRA